MGVNCNYIISWIIRWLPTSKMPALWQIGETGETWMYCKGDYQTRGWHRTWGPSTVALLSRPRCRSSDSVRKAPLQVVRQHLTPPTSSTNVERLFSIGGLTATDHRAALAGEKLYQILFLRENALMANFKLGWEWSVINCCTYNISWNLE